LLQAVFHLLKERRLAVATVLVEAMVDFDGEDEEDVYIFRRPCLGPFGPRANNESGWRLIGVAVITTLKALPDAELLSDAVVELIAR
jgi:hypothetical protein